MKKFLKSVATLLSAGVFALGLAGCSNDSDNDDGALATFVSTYNHKGSVSSDMISKFKINSTYLNKDYAYLKTMTVKFYDTTYEVTIDEKATSGGDTIYTNSRIQQKGSYSTDSGDFTNGTLFCVKTHEYDEDSDSLKEYSYSSSNTFIIKISGGEFSASLDEDDDEEDYTKQ